MGLDVSCSLVIGTPITEDLLFTTEQRWNYKSCCKDDVKKRRKFCSNCGLKFERVIIKGLTKEFTKLLEEEGFEIDCDVDDLYLYDLEMIHNVRSVSGGDDDWDDLVLGVIIGGTRSYRYGDSSPQPTSLDHIEEAIAKIKRMANTMNLSDIPIDLYPVLLVSV
jgi:hypothetical protein